uniref:Uncharacterized protein n=1 Tax=Branchiostoma floridae TaxID=7739 RepID=C3XRD9_BRAFL|eukprot:XP_002613248.1 hypothetical protein BRAFLDRAFT_68213 [Branchiostoma floridae]
MEVQVTIRTTASTKLSSSLVTSLVLSHNLRTTATNQTVQQSCYLPGVVPQPVVHQQNKTVEQSCYLPGVVPQPVVHQQTKLSNSPVTCLVLSHSLSYINKQNCPTVLLLAWCCPTACRTSTNQTVQQSCYLPGAVPQPAVHQQTKLSNSPVTCLVLSHSLSYTNEPNCPTVLLLAWCCPTACRTSTNKLSDSPVTCLVLSHSLSYINKQNCPTVLLPAWCCPTACRTSTNKTVQQSCYLPGAVPQPIVYINKPNCPTVLLLAWCRPTACRTSTNQTVQQSCYLPGAVPQPAVHQQTKLSNSPVTCLVLSHNLSYNNKQNCPTVLYTCLVLSNNPSYNYKSNCPTVLLLAWCCPTTCRDINKQNCPTVLLLAWCYPTTCRMTTTKTFQQSCYLSGVVYSMSYDNSKQKLSNSSIVQQTIA